MAVGTLQGGFAGASLLRLMAALYRPALLARAAWPDVVNKEFTGRASDKHFSLTARL